MISNHRAESRAAGWHANLSCFGRSHHGNTIGYLSGYWWRMGPYWWPWPERKWQEYTQGAESGNKSRGDVNKVELTLNTPTYTISAVDEMRTFLRKFNITTAQLHRKRQMARRKKFFLLCSFLELPFTSQSSCSCVWFIGRKVPRFSYKDDNNNILNSY